MAKKFYNLFNVFRGAIRRDAGGASATPPPYTPRPAGTVYGGGGDALWQPPKNLAAVYRCITLLAGSVAQLPLRLKVLRQGVYTAAGGLESDEALRRLLSVEPEPRFSAYDFWRQIVSDLLTAGNAFIYPVYGPGAAAPSELRYVSPAAVGIDLMADTYSICDLENGVNGTFAASEVVHFKLLGSHPRIGQSVLSHARATLAIGHAGDSQTLDQFRNHGKMRGIITGESGGGGRGLGTFSNGELATLAEDVEERLNQNHLIIYLPRRELRFQQTAFTASDMQFLESRKFTVREICRFFGVHPSLVFDDLASNYKDAEMSNVAFLSNTLNPILCGIEAELRRKLLAPQMQGRRLIEFDRSAMFASDLSGRAKYMTQLAALGCLTVNEARAMVNMPRVDGGDSLRQSSALLNNE